MRPAVFKLGRLLQMVLYLGINRSRDARRCGSYSLVGASTQPVCKRNAVSTRSQTSNRRDSLFSNDFNAVTVVTEVIG